MGNVPAYKIVYATLKKDIREGRYPTGSLLPTENELELAFDVSRTTIRKAISLLSADGYVKKKQGYGTEVLDYSTTQKLNYLTSTSETLKAKGLKVTTRGMDISIVKASKTVSEALDIPEGSKVYMIQRVQLADDAPIAIMVNYLKINDVPGIEDFIGKFTGLYEFLETQYYIILKSANEKLSAISADFNESQILQIPIGAPLLLSKRITYTEKGPLDYSIAKLVGDRYEYSVSMEGRK